MKPHTLLICNGEPPSANLVRKLAARAELVVAADGGANISRSCGIIPHLIVGDLDSIEPATRRAFSSVEFMHVARQDNTDLEKALDVLLQRGVKNVVLLAATGRRLDHTLGNLSVIWRYTPPMKLIIGSDDWVALPVGKERRLRTRPGTIVSLIPFGECSGITLTGLQYPLTNATMHVGEIGLSNVVLKSPWSVRVRSGNMLMIVHTELLSFLKHT